MVYLSWAAQNTPSHPTTLAPSLTMYNIKTWIGLLESRILIYCRKATFLAGNLDGGIGREEEIGVGLSGIGCTPVFPGFIRVKIFCFPLLLDHSWYPILLPL